jgi:ammonia channel protein AmtB
VICTIGYAFMEMRERRQPGGHVLAIAIASAVFFVLGWPLTVTFGAALSVIFGERLQQGIRSVRIATVIFSTVLGAIAVPVTWRYYGEADPHSVMVFTGAIAGLVAGTLLCYLAEDTQLDAVTGKVFPQSPP